MSHRLPRTEDEVIEHLLGAPRGVSVVVDGTTYVLPRGIDPYWEDFGRLYGYELLPHEERPIQVGPTRDIWRPGSPRPGFAEGRRKTWTNLPAAVTPEEPRLTWQALGDLRRCVGWAGNELDREKLLPAKVPQPSAETRPMVRLLREAMTLLESIERSQRTWPDPTPNETREIFGSLDHVVAALHRLRSAVLKADDDASGRSRRAALWQTMMGVGAACSPPPPYPRPARGRPAGALLVVHAAHHYFALCGTEATAQDLAMICGLEPDADFGAGSRYLAGTRAGREAGKRYWADRLRDYARATKT